MGNSTQLWVKGRKTDRTAFGFEKIYDWDNLRTYENNKGDYAVIIIDGKDRLEFHGEGAWNRARMCAELHLIKDEVSQ